MYSLDNGNIQLYRGDCLEVMPTLPEKSIDMILADLPYGTTSIKWDSIIPFDVLWNNYNRLSSLACLFASQPFTSALVMSNVKSFKYDWVWRKNQSYGFANANRQPLRDHESIVLFYTKQPVYKPIKQLSKSEQAIKQARKGTIVRRGAHVDRHGFGITPIQTPFQEFVHPTTVQEFDCVPRQHLTHPTQKPVALIEYLIKTYTNEGDIVLDNTMGSGTTGVACINTNRRFIGIEMDETYFQIAVDRCTKALQDKAL